ncbi:Eukaryotic translation initiation factor 3 subunit J [Halotydeus destructor]|nr:Eukaryotic translation initiation factor 3 subunit J [Halotydeus destructor]
MASWDEENRASPVVLKQGRDDRWEGEDEEDVPDAWDAEEEEPSEGTEVVPKPGAPSKKKSLLKKIAEKEEKERAKSRPMTAEEILADKLERQRLQEEADLRAGRDAFGIGDSGPGLDNLPLSTKEDFEAFKKNLVDRLQCAEKSPHYLPFLEAAFRDICASLEPDDIKKLSSNLNTLFNEKVKAMKGPKQKKGKAKAGIKVERTAMDVDGADYGDFDDFM